MTDYRKLATEALERAKRATPGPWHIGHVCENLDHAEIACPTSELVADVFAREDQCFIIAARTDVPALAKAVLELDDKLSKAIGSLRYIATNSVTYSTDQQLRFDIANLCGEAIQALREIDHFGCRGCPDCQGIKSDLPAGEID